MPIPGRATPQAVLISPRTDTSLRLTCASPSRWNIDTCSPEAERMFHQIETDTVTGRCP